MSCRFHSLAGRSGLVGWIVLASIMAGSPLVRGQTDTPSGRLTTEAARGELAERYVDGSFGFAVRPPAGCATLREQRLVGAAEVEPVRFVHPDYRWSLAVRRSKTPRPLDTEMIIKSITEGISEKCPDVKVIFGKQARIASRQGVRYASTLTVAGVPVLHQQAVVRTGPTEYSALIFVTPQSDREVAMTLFDRVVNSFEVLRSEEKEKQLGEALARGTALLRSVAAGEIDLARSTRGETFLRCIVEGKDVGFIQIREEATTQGYRKGVAVSKWLWLFMPDGSITHMRHGMFLANDLSHEKWESRRLILTPSQEDVGRQAILDVESAVRQDDKLLITYTAQPNAPRLTEKVIAVEPSYASAPWEVLLPRLVDLNKSELYAFLLYDNGRRGPAVRAFRVAGQKNLRFGDRIVSAVKIEDSEGLVPPIHDMYVDKTGRVLRVVLRVEASPMEMVATTREHIERLYGDRLKETQALLQKHPVREPLPP